MAYCISLCEYSDASSNLGLVLFEGYVGLWYYVKLSERVTSVFGKQFREKNKEASLSTERMYTSL